ncbi:RnfH family protein [Pseudoalteromonas tunicata]|uniref:RnfH family protein n=1 Tax=Pseudoalteromonas tunicata TaxID=314281 RepID=UPI00273E0E9C|nr:RnfH family protein [Pseudoalteromonas tunicata]MDP4982789.1 RnfH family protein [Pseudoalteromonas tunicata]MDP5213724.1 RnfH family protein [Pseudoalteromonas tunicata]
MINIEIVFALPDSATSLKLQVAEHTTVEEAISGSGILEKCPEIDADNLSVGIWNRTCKLHQQLQDGDRIEIYRPLIADPKDARRRRAEKAKEEGRANKITGGKPLK